MTQVRRSKKTQKLPLDRSIRAISGLLRIRAGNHLTELYKFRGRTSSHDLFSAFPRIFGKREQWDDIFGKAMPTSLDQILKLDIYAPVGVMNEIVWACARSIQYGDELRQFLALSHSLESSVLRDMREESEQVMNAIEVHLGQSIWLVQTRLAALHRWGGLEESTKVLRRYQEQPGLQPLTSAILRFTGRKLEGAAIKDQLNSELSRLFQDGKSTLLEKYLRAKVLELPDLRLEDFSALLFVDSYSSILDYYESLIRVLQSAASNNSIPLDFLVELQRPIAALYKKTLDVRLKGIARGLGINLNLANEIDDDRAEAIEAYSCGAYLRASTLAYSRLSRRPDDTAMYLLLAKAAEHTCTLTPPLSDLQTTIVSNLRKVISLSDDGAYAAALELITLFDRFYSSNWSHHLRAILFHELRREQRYFPSDWMRDVYVRDQFISPFSAIAAVGLEKKCILQDKELAAIYPATTEVFQATCNGEIAKNSKSEVSRLKAYAARYLLNEGRAEEALPLFEWLRQNSLGAERSRSAGGSALAYLVSGDLDGAVRTIVDEILERPHVFSVLPIKEIADSLDNPDKWPSGIMTPIFLEMRASLLDPEKITDARYAFERFQIANNITNPQDVIKQIGKWDERKVTAYLDSVWRPEVMRQTILYSGTREIEEARIEVCRALLEFGKSAAPGKLADEIKERVKQLEIAKGATLVHQSKVFVDVETIRRALRAKLTEPYARYKSSLDVAPLKSDETLRKITEALTQISDEKNISMGLVLSQLHVMDDADAPTNEADAQFTTIFEEVTNEFLLGNHGLNAFLSTRVRHGTLSNTLRKPVADEKLVTAKKAVGFGYSENKHWQLQESPAFNQKIQAALSKFAATFDGIIASLNDEMIQVKIVRGISDVEADSKALFKYYSSPLERRHLQHKSGKISQVDDLIDLCIDSLWEKTDWSLLTVQSTLKNIIRDQIATAFDQLSEEIEGVSQFDSVGDLASAVSRARTGVQNQLTLVGSWFKRSEVFDRQDYSADFPVHIATNMLKSSITGIEGWNGLEINVLTGDELLPGRTLDAMVDMFDCAIENAIKHSGLDAEFVCVKTKIEIQGGHYRAVMENNLAADTPSAEKREKIERIRRLMQHKEGAARAQLEEGSGLHKIWRALSSSAFKEPRLDFFFMKDESTNLYSFILEIDFRFERAADENSVN